MVKNRATCIGCRYRRAASGMNPSETVCHYLLDCGVPRGCPADCCTHWQPLVGYGPSLDYIICRGDTDVK